MPISYSPRRARYQLLFVAFATLLLTGCGNITIPLSGFTESDEDGVDYTTTGSTSSHGGDTIAVSDLATVNSAITAAVKSGEDLYPIPWANDSTGRSGTVLRNAQSEETVGANCRSYQILVSEPDTVKHLKGTSCQQTDGRWKLGDLSRADLTE